MPSNKGDMKQAIFTKSLGPTPRHPPRIKAWCRATSVTDFANADSMPLAQRHEQVAMILANTLGWPIHNWVQGYNPDTNGYAFVYTGGNDV